MLDSLSIVAILEILVEMTGNEDVLTQANASDFRNLASIRAFYEKTLTCAGSPASSGRRPSQTLMPFESPFQKGSRRDRRLAGVRAFP